MDQIELVKNKTDIIELINSYIPLKKAGRNFKSPCPFHSEKTPSFIVSPERQIFKCFGCQEGGNVFNFLMKYENMEFGEALRFLADRSGIKLKSFKPSKSHQEKEELLAINHLASEFYHYILLNHKAGKAGLDYLLGRGINRSSIKDFKLGYAPDSWENLQDYLAGKKNYPRSNLEKSGLIIKSSRPNARGGVSYYDRFRGRIIFPLLDHLGNTVGFSGRTLKPDLKEAKYINTPETILYHKANLFYGLNISKKFIKEKKQAIIAEGEFDLISSYQGGIKNVIAIKGSALTENQVNLIKRFTDNIALALDEDAAGDAAMRRGIETADAEGLNIRVIQVQYGKDPDECARHSFRLWRDSVKKAIPIYDFYLKSAVSRFAKKKAEGKKRISEELVPILAKITNEVIKAHYVKKLAGVLSVNEDAVLREMDRWERTNDVKREFVKKPVSSAKDSQVEKTRREMLEELLLAYVLQKERKIKKSLEMIDLDHIKSNTIKRIFKALKEFVKNTKTDFKINNFVNKLAKELLETLDMAYLYDLKIDLKDDKRFKQELERTKIELEKLFLKEKLTVFVEKIGEFEKAGKLGKLENLKKEFDKISQELRRLT